MAASSCAMSRCGMPDTYLPPSRTFPVHGAVVTASATFLRVGIEFEADKDKRFSSYLARGSQQRDKSALKLFQKESVDHSHLHLDQLKYNPPDQMDEVSREQATEYMTSNDCVFDMRVIT
eukprot:4024761-Pleurochrysis_carterae.AAC.3